MSSIQNGFNDPDVTCTAKMGDRFMLLYAETVKGDLILHTRTSRGEYKQVQRSDFFELHVGVRPGGGIFDGIHERILSSLSAKTVDGVCSLYTNCEGENIRFFIVSGPSEHRNDVRFCYSKSPNVYTLYDDVCHEQWFLIKHAICPFGWISGIDKDVPLSLSGDIGVPHEDAPPEHFLKVLWFDIEVVDERGCFPDAQHGEVVMIGCSVGRKKVIFTTRSLEIFDPEVNIVIVHHGESRMLCAFAKFIQDEDVDIIAGYNISGFDLPFLINRAEQLGVMSEMTSLLSRVANHPMTMREKTTDTAQKGKRVFYTFDFHGRMAYDLLEVIRSEYRLNSYTLNNVSQEFLNDRKEDVHHSQIMRLWNESDRTRARLAKYCMKDVILCVRIYDHLQLESRFVEMCRATGVDLKHLVEFGQQNRAVSLIMRMCREDKMWCPLRTRGTQYSPDEYEGAIVLDPVCGYYDEKTPVMVLDFSSLYPSIAIANNYCYTSFIPVEKRKFFRNEDMYLSPAGHSFLRVSKTGREGVFPRLLRSLLQMRQATKKKMKSFLSNDPNYQVMDSRQLAFKICANSLYGFTAVKEGGQLPMFEIAESITCSGRGAITKTRDFVKATWPGTDVIYGDTDSIFLVNKTVDTVEKAFAFMNESAARITSHLFSPPMMILPEKCYLGFILIAKKRYIGLQFNHLDAKAENAKITSKGTEEVRRDSCPLVGKTLRRACELIFRERNVQGAVDFVQDVVRNVYLKRIPISDLLITRSLSRETTEYVNAQSHSILVEKMRKRDPSLVIRVGDRIPFLMIHQNGGGKEKVCEMAEDPLYAIEHELEPSVSYIIEHQLRGPLERLFSPVLGVDGVGILFSGDHSRHVVKSKLGKRPGTLAGFFKPQKQCAGCSLYFSTMVGRLCDTCQPNTQHIQERESARVDGLKRKYDEVVLECQRCQGDDGEVFCMARDCPNLYTRIQAREEWSRACRDIEDLA